MNEYSWKELAKLFEELSTKLGSARLDFQLGNVPQNVHLAAYNDQNSRDIFIALSQIAGSKLLELINKNDYEDLKDITNPVKFWCYSLKVFSDRFKVELIGEQKDDEGNKIGFVYVGNIYDVCNVSSNTCMQFAAQYANHNIKKDEKLSNDGIVGELEESKKRLQVLLRKFVKSNAQHLQNSLRNIADNHLHQPIRKKEVLPTSNQINFSSDLDVILSEINRILK